MSRPAKNKDIPGICKRLAEIRTFHYQGSNRKFAQALCINESYASNICNGNIVPGRRVLEDIIRKLPGITSEWLMLGEGDKPHISTSEDGYVLLKKFMNRSSFDFVSSVAEFVRNTERNNDVFRMRISELEESNNELKSRLSTLEKLIIDNHGKERM